MEGTETISDRSHQVTIRFVGDVHADYGAYLSIIEGCDRSVQVGDFGIGFRPNPIDLYDTSKHKFIRGNHDWPEGCKQEPNWIKDGTFDPELGIMYMGGAYSIDKAYRTPGRDWWEDEELSYNDLNVLIDQYAINKPDIVVAHEIPEGVNFAVLPRQLPIGSRTRDAFAEMFRIHQPKLWIAGHWHVSFNQVINGTRFVVLNINEYMDITLTRA